MPIMSACNLMLVSLFVVAFLPLFCLSQHSGHGSAVSVERCVNNTLDSMSFDLDDIPAIDAFINHAAAIFITIATGYPQIYPAAFLAVGSPPPVQMEALAFDLGNVSLSIIKETLLACGAGALGSDFGEGTPESDLREGTLGSENRLEERMMFIRSFSPLTPALGQRSPFATVSKRMAASREVTPDEDMESKIWEDAASEAWQRLKARHNGTIPDEAVIRARAMGGGIAAGMWSSMAATGLINTAAGGVAEVPILAGLVKVIGTGLSLSKVILDDAASLSGIGGVWLCDHLGIEEREESVCADLEGDELERCRTNVHNDLLDCKDKAIIYSGSIHEFGNTAIDVMEFAEGVKGMRNTGRKLTELSESTLMRNPLHNEPFQEGLSELAESMAKIIKSVGEFTSDVVDDISNLGGVDSIYQPDDPLLDAATEFVETQTPTSTSAEETEEGVGSIVTDEDEQNGSGRRLIGEGTHIGETNPE